MEYRYGAGPDEVHEFFRSKRPWSRVKDKIVHDYVQCYLKTVTRLFRPILIVDGFAGPGRFGDGCDGSPLIICKAVQERARGQSAMSCLFADAHPEHRTSLALNLKAFIERGITGPPFADFAQALTRALEIGADSTVFFYLDPYGIKDLEFDLVKQIYERSKRRSTEVLINFSFRTFMRMSGNWNYADAASVVAGKVKQAKVETVSKVMGGDYWLDIITNPHLNKIEREDAIVGGYLERVRQYFRYAYAVPVKERQENEYGIPDDELARYHLVFGTRSARAVVYMNDVARNALEPYLRQFVEGLLFDLTPQRYQAADREQVKGDIVKAVQLTPKKRMEIYEDVIPSYFMQYRKKEYRAMIDELAFTEGRLFPDKRTMVRARQLNEDTFLSAKPWPDALI